MTTSATIATEISTVQRPEHKVAAHIREAAEATGVPFEFLLAQANQESRLNPDAKNRRSSAMGLFQFTAGTWLDMVKKHGAEHGLGDYAAAIVRGPDGRLTVKDKDLRKEILELRRDPKLSALMAAEYAKDNEKVLTAKLGRPVSTHDLYLAHFLGAGGALKVLRGRHEPEGDQAPPLLAGAAQANPDVFTDPGTGERRSLDSVYAAVERRFRRAMSEANRLANAMDPQTDLATLRPAERPDDAPTILAEADSQGRDQEQSQEQNQNHVAEAVPDIAAEASITLSLADIPLAVGSFPARLPPRSGAAAKEETLQPYPVPLPPPVTGNRADTASLTSLLTVNEEKG